MQWKDRQGSSSVQDIRAISADPLYQLIVESNATMDQLEAMKHRMGTQVPPMPSRKYNWPEGSWQGNALRSAQEFMAPSGDVPLPKPRPRRYTNAQD